MVIWAFFEDAWVGLVGTRYHVGRSGDKETGDEKIFLVGKEKTGLT